MPSFDIVSEIDSHELTNAIDQANRMIMTRFDFRGVEASFEFVEDNVKIHAESDFQIKQLLEMLHACLIKRSIDISCCEEKDIVHSGKTFSQVIEINQGIDKDIAKKIVKIIKESKIKVQASIQGEQVRVTGKKRDELQEVMALLRESDVGLPLQFNNFRD